jgi:hypothetical protein
MACSKRFGVDRPTQGETHRRLAALAGCTRQSEILNAASRVGRMHERAPLPYTGPSVMRKAVCARDGMLYKP